MQTPSHPGTSAVISVIGVQHAMDRLEELAGLCHQAAEELLRSQSRAAEARELYDRLSTRSEPVNDILERAAKSLAEGEKPNAV